MRILLALLLLLAPTASASPWDRALEIEPAPYHLGDALVHLERTGFEGAPFVENSRIELTTLVEGDASARDRFGIQRDTLAFRVDARFDGAPPESFVAMRCHRLRGAADLVRMDWLQHGDGLGAESTVDATTGAVRSRRIEGGLLASFDQPLCTGAALPGTMRLREGEPIRLSDAAPFLPALPEIDVASAPAEATTFHGRPALRYAFELTDALERLPRDELAATGVMTRTLGGSATLVIAEGIPGAANVSITADMEDSGQRWRWTWMREVAAYAEAAGEARPRAEGVALPARAPDATFAPLSPAALPDHALGLAFSSREAWQAAIDDPRAGLAAYARAHPDARLVNAVYRRGGEGVESAASDGVWTFWVDDGALGQIVTVERRSAVATQGALLPLPMPLYDVGASELESHGLPPLVDAPDGASLQRLLAEAGIDAARVRLLEYSNVVTYAALTDGRRDIELVVSEIDEADDAPQDGREARVILATGALVEIADYSLGERRAGALAVDAQPFAKMSSVPPLTRVPPGVGLAAGAITLVALLGLALFPLYSRLRRARLLDNPLRARLVELVRAEPGIRRRELDAALGRGIGATRHHLDLLVEHGYLVEMREHGAAAYYLAGHVSPEEARRLLVLRNETTRRLHELLQTEPGLSLRAAAGRLGVSAPSLLRHKRRLEKEGLLARPEIEA